MDEIQVDVYYLNWPRATEKLGEQAVMDWDHKVLIREVASGKFDLWDKLHTMTIQSYNSDAELAEQLFDQFNQDEHPLTTPEMQKKIGSMGSHTSMTARDFFVIRRGKEGSIWFCKSQGWQML